MSSPSFLKNIAITKPRNTVVMVLIVGILLTLAITAIIWSDARKDYRERFDYDASMRVGSVAMYLDTQLQDIDSLTRCGETGNAFCKKALMGMCQNHSLPVNL